jgi:ATP-binding cassette subfamily C protein
MTSVDFMSSRERIKLLLLTTLRALLSFLDLAGILAIGLVVTSTAFFLTSGSDPNRILDFAGLKLPAINAQTLPLVSLGVLMLFLAKALLSVVLTKRVAFFVATVEARSAKTIAEISFGGDLGDARKRSQEEMMYAIQQGSPSAFNGLLNSANTFLTESMLFLVIIIGFLLVDPLATFAAVIYFSIVAIMIQYFVGSRMYEAGQIVADGSIQANTAVSDLLAVFRELLVLGKREKYVEAIYRARLAAADSAATQHYLSGMPRYIIEASLLVGVGLFVLAQAMTGDIAKSAATLGVFLSGGFRLTAALLPLQSALLSIKSLIPAAKTAQEILRLAPSFLPYTNSRTSEVFDTRRLTNTPDHRTPLGVNFQDVSFSYKASDRPAISNVTFEIKPGAQVAFMGPSGAGKSTIADLLCQVLSPTSGSILMTKAAGSEVKGLGPAGVSYVPQKPGLVSGTILENVALGEDLETASRDRAIEALRLAHLEALIEDLPEGLDTQLGKLKDGFSGGQMQRLGLARALYTRPGLLIMDEATSALDADSEAEIQTALNQMRGTVTVVLIAHRLNTIQHADKVFLVENGQISDSGSFKELNARNPSVSRVVNLMKIESK